MRGSLRFLKRSERGDGAFWGGIGKGFFFVRVFLEVPGVGMVTGVGKRSNELLTLIIVKFDRQPDAIAPFLLSSTAALARRFLSCFFFRDIYLLSCDR